MKNLTLKLKSLPINSGCYIMKDRFGYVIYVGKAINLKNRVNQYFRGANDYKTTRLVKEIADFDFVVTQNEKEALILEYNLIKKYNPKYNVIFRDDKSYPYIAISDEDFFTVKVVRIHKRKYKSKLFGPYPNASAATKMVELINKLFPIRKCKYLPKEVCFYYHLKQCLGYCAYPCDKKIIDDMRQKIIKLLKGDVQDVLKELIEKRDSSSNNLNFEYAKQCQDLITSIEHIALNQNVQLSTKDDIDIFDYYLKDHRISICIISLRKGIIINFHTDFITLNDDCLEQLVTYICSYYQKNILCEEFVVRDPKLKDMLELYSDDLNVRVYTKGKKYDLLNKALDNVRQYYASQISIVHKKENYYQDLRQDFINLFSKPINMIEIFDNSHLAGSNTVGAMVVFKDFKPSKNDYRLFKLNDSQDDLKSMYELLYRHYFRVLNDNLRLSDILIVDGGYNQIKVANKVISELDLDIIVLGLGKDKKHNTNYLMNHNYEIIDIDKNSHIFYFLSTLQDEVHRYAINYHRKLETKKLQDLELTKINLVGLKTVQKLLKHFKSFENIKNASLDELSKVVSLKVSKNIYNYFRR